MKFCPKCGTANTNSSTKCSCGEDLSNVTAENSKSIVSHNANSGPFASSSTCKNLVWVFIVLAFIGSIIGNTAFHSMGYAVFIAVIFIESAVFFAILGGLLRNQELQNELLKEMLEELKNKK